MSKRLVSKITRLLMGFMILSVLVLALPAPVVLFSTRFPPALAWVRWP